MCHVQNTAILAENADFFAYLKKKLYLCRKMRNTYLHIVLLLCFFAQWCFADELSLIRLYTPADTTEYTDFPTALTKANKSPQAKMVLLGDVRFAGGAKTQTLKTNLFLDLNGYSFGDTLLNTSLLSLGIDTLGLHITSSRPGGRLWVTRPNYNGRIYAVSVNKGQLTIDSITIEAENLSDPTMPNAAATAVSTGSAGFLRMHDCTMRVQSSGTAYAIYLSAADTIPLSKVVRTRIQVSARQQATGVLNKGLLDLEDDTVSVQTTFNTCYGYHAYATNAQCRMSRCSFIAEAGTTTTCGAFSQLGHLYAEDCRFEATCRLDTATIVTSCGTRAFSIGPGYTASLQRCVLNARSLRPLLAKSIYAISGNTSSRLTVEDCELYTEGAESVYSITNGSQMQIRNCQVRVDCKGSPTYGIFINNYRDTTVQADARATIEDTYVLCTAKNSAYPVYSNAPVDLIRDTVICRVEKERATAFYAARDTTWYHVSQCYFSAEAGFISAYGANIARGFLEANDCSFICKARQDTAQIKMTDCSARGIAISANGIATLRRCTIQAQGTNHSVARGVSGITGNASARLRIEDCFITAQGAENTYGINNGCQLDVTRCHIDVRSAGNTAYCINTQAPKEDSDTVRVSDCYLKAQAQDKAFVINNNTKAYGRMFLYGGYYSEREYLSKYLPQGSCVYKISSGAEYAAGYNYVIRPIANPGVPVAKLYRNGQLVNTYNRLSDALEYMQFNEGAYTTVVEGSCQLGAGTYYIPDYATLVIAHQEGQSSAIGTTAARSSTADRNRKEYARVEMLDNAALIVEGVLEVSAWQQDENNAVGTVSGATGFGHLHLASSASITMESGSQLQAWGYITGTGTISALSGSQVREFLQIGDWKGGSITYYMLNNTQHVFPITHFFYQNIECPIVYHKGCRAYGSSFMMISSLSAVHDDIRLIDNRNALFVIPDDADDDTYIRKAYDPLTDRLTWSTYGDVSIDQLSIKHTNPLISNYSLISTQYVLPISTNTTISVLSGTLHIPHDLALLPGCLMEVLPQAQVHIPSGTKLYVYDRNQWCDFNNKSYITVSYSPSWNTCPRDTNLVSARIVVGGGITVEGALYTTESGADILGCDSVEGQITFVNGAYGNGDVYQLTGSFENYWYAQQTAIPAALRNADSTYVYTLNAEAGDTYIYHEGLWLVPHTTVATTPVHSTSRGRLVMREGTIYVQTPDNRIYTLLGISAHF